MPGNSDNETSKKRKKKQKTKPGSSKRARTNRAKYTIEDRTFYYFGGDCYTILRENEKTTPLCAKMRDVTLPKEYQPDFNYKKVSNRIIRLIAPDNSRQTETDCREKLKAKFSENITLTPLLSSNLDAKIIDEVKTSAGGTYYAKRRNYHYLDRHCYLFLNESKKDSDAIITSFNQLFCFYSEAPVWSKISDSILQLEHPEIKSHSIIDKERYRAFIRTRLKFTQAEKVSITETNSNEEKRIKSALTKKTGTPTAFFKPLTPPSSSNTPAMTTSPAMSPG